jgi:hypothetical protein
MTSLLTVLFPGCSGRHTEFGKAQSGKREKFDF